MILTMQDVLDGDCTEEEYIKNRRWVLSMYLAMEGKIAPPDKVPVWKNYTAEYKPEGPQCES